MASRAKSPKTAGGSDGEEHLEHASRDYAAPTAVNARLRRRRPPGGDGSAGGGRLALGRDAGHRVGPALGLVVAPGRASGTPSGSSSGSSGGSPLGASSGGARLVAHGRHATRPPSGATATRLAPSHAGVITFLSDYGHDDDFVGVCHGVIARIAPEARVIDLTHGIPRHDMRSGALVLRRALPYFPAGVHLAVVDPEVGGERRAVALRTAEEDRILVGPDNGLLALAASASAASLEAVDIARSPHRLEPTSATFHGRDLFAPVAAHLAAGAPLADAGEPIDADELTRAAHAAAPAARTAASSPTRWPSTASAT